MSEFNPSKERPDEEVLTGKVFKPEIVPTKETGYDPLDTAPSYPLMSSRDYENTMAAQDGAAKKELKNAIEGRNRYHQSPARHTKPDTPRGVGADQVSAIQTAKKLRDSH